MPVRQAPIRCSGGAYGRKTWGATFLDLAVIGGSLDNSSRRNIFGGLAAQVANANYGGWFINPSLSFGRTFDVNPLGITVTPALKVRYVDAHFDGYMESGSTANLTVNGRDFAAWEERAELTFADTAKWGASRITGRVTIGGLAQQRTGGGLVDIAFLGQSFLASTPDRASITGGFGSAGIDWQIGNLTVFATGEAMASDDSSRVYSGRGGVRLNW
jgi:outer membrane autotransporter protein